MNFRNVIFITLMFAVFSFSREVVAKDTVYQNRDFELINGLLKAEDYKVADKHHSKFAKNIDLSSDKNAMAYKTRLRDGFKEKPDFAGHYVVVSFGCGTQCMDYWIVDKITGKIIFHEDAGNGAAYSLDSRLFVINPPELEMQDGADVPLDSVRDYFTSTKYFEEKNGKMNLIKDVFPFQLKGSHK